MSLDPEQRRRTAAEFQAALAAAGLTPDELRVRIGLPAERFDAALAVAPGADPVDVWLVRDTVDTAAREAGGDPRFSVLTERMRAAAGGWFGVRDQR